MKDLQVYSVNYASGAHTVAWHAMCGSDRLQEFFYSLARASECGLQQPQAAPGFYSVKKHWGNRLPYAFT